MQGILKPFEVRDRRAKERFVIDDIYLNGWAKKCGIYATGVYISLCRHANTDQYCWPSQKKIAEELDISRDKVIEALQILEKHNIIVKERIGKKSNNRYWLTDKSEWQDMPISDVANSDITCRPQRHHHVANSDIHSKDTHIKDTQVRLPPSAEKNMKRMIEENEFSDTGETTINQDGEEIDPELPKGIAGELILWAQERMGKKFPTYGKQNGSIGRMKRAGYSAEDIQNCWIRLEKDKFWKDKGIDFGIVLMEIGKSTGKKQDLSKYAGL